MLSPATDIAAPKAKSHARSRISNGSGLLQGAMAAQPLLAAIAISFRTYAPTLAATPLLRRKSSSGEPQSWQRGRRPGKRQPLPAPRSWTSGHSPPLAIHFADSFKTVLRLLLGTSRPISPVT